MTKPAQKPRLAVVATAAAILIAGAATWAVYNRSASTAPSAASVNPADTTAVGAKPVAKTLDKPLWRELSRNQQAALAPLKPEWDHLEGMRKRRWLELSARFASMSPAEQKRVHDRMREWMRLTPEQRNLARENFNKTRRLDPGSKAATWESYKQLSEEERRKLARSGNKPQGVPAMPHSPMIDTPVTCPPGAMRRGTACILPAPASTTAANPAPAAPATAPSSVPAPTPTAVPPAQNASNASSPSNASASNTSN